MQGEDIKAVAQIAIPATLILLGLGWMAYHISEILPFLKNLIFLVPASLMLGLCILLESFEKDHLWHLGLLGIYLIYSLIFGLVMFIAFVVVWILWLGLIYPIKRESKMDFNAK